MTKKADDEKNDAKKGRAEGAIFPPPEGVQTYDAMRGQTGPDEPEMPPTAPGKMWIRNQDTGAITEVEKADFKKHPEKYGDAAECQADGSPLPVK
jgi:hypothetical protein